MLRRLLALSTALLVAFHIWLFAGQLWDGALAAEPALVFRWAVAGILAAGLLALHRTGASLVRGRKACAMWLVALLLHGPAIADRINVVDAPALPEIVLTIVTVVGVAGMATGLAGLVSRRLLTRPSTGITSAPLAVFAGLDAGAYLCFSPRPPPHA